MACIPGRLGPIKETQPGSVRLGRRPKLPADWPIIHIILRRPSSYTQEARANGAFRLYSRVLVSNSCPCEFIERRVDTLPWKTESIPLVDPYTTLICKGRQVEGWCSRQDTDIHKHTHILRHILRVRHTQTQKHRQTQTDTDRHRQTQTHSHTTTYRQTDNVY